MAWHVNDDQVITRFVVIIRFEPLVQLEQGAHVLMQEIYIKGREDAAAKRPRLPPVQPRLTHEVLDAKLPAFLRASWDLLALLLSSGLICAVIKHDIQPRHDEISQDALLMDSDNIIVLLKLCLLGLLAIGSTMQGQCLFVMAMASVITNSGSESDH